MKTRPLSARHAFSALLFAFAASLAACAGSDPVPDNGPPPVYSSEVPPPVTATVGQPTAAPTATQTAAPVATAAPTAEPTAAPTAVASAAPTKAVSEPAGANLHVGSMAVDGLTLEDLACKADGLGMLGSMIVVGSIAKKKAALNACGKGKPRVTWTATKGTIGTVTVKADNNAKMEACVAKALKGTQAPFEGECAATLVLGK
jgi:hypothetical protein